MIISKVSLQRTCGSYIYSFCNLTKFDFINVDFKWIHSKILFHFVLNGICNKSGNFLCLVK